VRPGTATSPCSSSKITRPARSAFAKPKLSATAPRDLRLLALDGPAQGQLALGLLGAPAVPGAGEEAAPAGLELEHRGAHRLEEPAVVGHEHDRGVERLQRALEPLERGDVEVVGGLVEQQQVGVAGQRAGQRGSGQLPARQRVQLAVEVAVGEPEAVDGGQRPVAPAVSARVLEPGLGAGVGVERALVDRAAGHGLLEPVQLALDAQQLGAAGQHVVAQGEPAVARRALVVQRHPRPLLEHDLAAVERGLAGEHAQQGGLARAVAAGERQAVAALELERHPAQQRLPGHVLAQVRGDEDGHGGGPL
jgi:hypothetical protein